MSKTPWSKTRVDNEIDYGRICRYCPFWDKTGVLDITVDGISRMCLKLDIPTSANEGCSFATKWEYLAYFGEY